MVSLRTVHSFKALFSGAVFGLVFAGLFSFAAAQTVDNEDIRQVAQDVLADPGLQTTMPEREDVPDLPDLPNIPKWVAKTIGIIVFSSVAIGILIILYLLVRSLMDRRLRKDGAVTVAKKEPDKTPVVPSKVKVLDEMPLPTLTDAERLAKEGAYTEAIHVLLLLAIDDIRKRSQEILHPSLTGREIFGRAKLSGDVAAVVKFILQTSERAYFGHKKADEGDYQTCRDRYRQFQSAFHTAGAG